MGLCKCPKRKVTNQFCFEHRVNVCEHCMVQKHPKCVVQSYLAWLQDSDYNPRCEFCDQDLADEQCVRLSCYHVFHWGCLDKYARSFPSDTAPAGYCCPNCKECIFPSDNLVSPVADALRDRLKDVNWARAGLGLPLLEKREERRPQVPRPSTAGGGGGLTMSSSSSSLSSAPTGPRPAPEGGIQTSSLGGGEQGAGVHMSGGSGGGGGDGGSNFDTATSRKTGGSSYVDYSELQKSPLLQNNEDHDDNKYKRKSALELLMRWFKTLLGPSARRKRGSKVQRFLMIGVLVGLGFITLIVILSYLARSEDYTDPMLEPMNNPNIRVGSDR